MLSLTSEYVLRAAIHLARYGDQGPISGRRIAEAEGIPRKYLAKVLGDLARSGVLASCPGKTGGFRLECDPREMTLYELLAPFERFESARCPFKNRTSKPGRAYRKWVELVEARRKFLQEVSLQDVANEAPTVPSSALDQEEAPES